MSKTKNKKAAAPRAKASKKKTVKVVTPIIPIDPEFEENLSDAISTAESLVHDLTQILEHGLTQERVDNIRWHADEGLNLDVIADNLEEALNPNEEEE